MSLNASSDDLKAQAGAWDARLRSHDCTPQERDGFAAWLSEDVRNEQNFDQLQAALAVLRKSSDHPQLQGLWEGARMLEWRSARYRLLSRVSMVVSLITIVMASVFWQMHQRAIVFRMDPAPFAPTFGTFSSTGSDAWKTADREWKHIALPDGSSITMNASSRLQVEFLAGERRVHLLSGQALFRVSKNPSRPFIVAAGPSTVTALGTTFDVQLRPDDLRVTLVEGRVAVKRVPEASGPSVFELTSSQRFEMTGSASPTVRHVDAVIETAWADGQIIFSDASLPDAVAQMNHFSKTQIIAGPELSRFRVNGMFRVGNQENFVSAVTSYYPIGALHDSNGQIILEFRPR